MSEKNIITSNYYLMQLMDLAQGFDRSWSFTSSGFEDRALLFLPSSSIVLELLSETAAEFGFNAKVIAAYRSLTEGADALGLTLSTSGSTRLYLQYWNRMTTRVAAGDLSPAPLYIGLKNFADGTFRTDVYYCQPLAPETEYRPTLQKALVDFGCDSDSVQRLLAPLTPETCIWTRTQGSGRTSWLATLRRAEISATEMAEALSAVSERPGVSAVIDALKQGAPLHLAGGEDTQKGRFLTFYVETDRIGAEQFCNGHRQVVPPY